MSIANLFPNNNYKSNAKDGQPGLHSSISFYAANRENVCAFCGVGA